MAKAKLKLAAPMALRISFIMMIDPFPQSRAMVTARGGKARCATSAGQNWVLH